MARQKQKIVPSGQLKPDRSPVRDLRRDNEELRAKLAETEETLRAICSGEVDAVVVSGPNGDQLFTLKGAEYAYRALVEAMNEGAATISSEGAVLYCNQRLADLLGRPGQIIIGAAVTKLVAPSSREAFAALFAQALAGEPGKAEIKLQAADEQHVTSYVSLRRMEGDDPAAVCMVVTDLTEHKKRDELINAGELARSILASTREAIAVCDKDGVIISANQALCDVCGLNPLFQPFDAVLPLQIKDENSRAAIRFSVMAALAGQRFRAVEASLPRGDGNELTLLLSTSSVAVKSGIAGCVVTLTDITDRRIAEQALLRSEKLAALGRMAASIAHEVNNPLAAAINSVFIASGDTGLSEQGHKVLELADQELRRAAHIIQRTLGFYRNQNNATRVELPKIMDEIVGLYASKLHERGIDLRQRYRCSGCPGACFVANAGELRQVISNLLTNCLDAIRDSGTLHLRLARLSEFRGNGDVIRLTVADTGTGISREHLPHLFEPFFTTKESTGTGLGLWITQEIVRKYGGSIRVRSQEGRGTVFCVTIPAMPPENTTSTDTDTGTVARGCGPLSLKKPDDKSS